jgi:DNA repair protein RecN (Recombination protein N)
VLLELRVENLLLIERAELRLGPGLTAITGETGAGKTVLAHALDLLLGGRARRGIVRPGAAEAYVEGVFALAPGVLEGDDLADLRDRLPEDADEVVLGRRVSAEGRTRAFVQGRAASADDLRELGGRLVAFYGQHEHRKLTVASAQLEVLDRFAGAAHLSEREALAAVHRRVASLSGRVADLRDRGGARERDRDLLAFELGEIEALGPSAEERAVLTEERERLRGSDALRFAATACVEALAPETPDGVGVASLLAAAEVEALGAAPHDRALEELAERVAAVRIEAEELGADMRRYRDELEADPGRLDEVEARLELYERLERKHGGTIRSVLEHAARCQARLEELDDSGAVLERAERELEEATAELERRAAAVTAAREIAAPELALRVLDELGALAMEGAAFEVRLEPRAEIGPAGAEGVEFMLAANPGVPAAPLRESASGGELSRTMLALMTVASAPRPTSAEAGGAGEGSDSAGPATLVFDEVDAGIGGQTARALGERLRRLAGGRQVIAITHLPQIASLADRHFRIEKVAGGDVARATVEPLRDDAVVAELCRMLGADADDAGARRHAQELLAAA